MPSESLIVLTSAIRLDLSANPCRFGIIMSFDARILCFGDDLEAAIDTLWVLEG
jgi:hypothetical protein